MNGMTLGDIGALLAICTSICSVASFYVGRQRAATEEGEKEGHVSTDLQYIKDYIRDTSKSLDALTAKLDAQNKQREQDYRELLVKMTELKTNYESMLLRVDNLEKQVEKYHHQL